MFPRFSECRYKEVEMKMYKNVISVEIRVNGEKLDEVVSFKYLGDSLFSLQSPASASDKI